MKVIKSEKDLVRLMKKRYYFDKKSGITLLLCLGIIILPCAVILSKLYLAGALLGTAVILFRDIHIAYRIFLILLIMILFPMIIGFVKIIKFCIEKIGFYLSYIEIDDEGVTCRFFSRVQKHWGWDEVFECGVGWEFQRIPKDHKALQEVEEKFVHDMFKYRNINGTKYIFFSKKKISLIEKMEIFYGQQKKDYLIAVKYSPQLAEYLHSTGRLGCKETPVRERPKEKPQLKDMHIKLDDSVKFKQFVDKTTGLGNLIMLLWFLLILVLFSIANIIFTDQYKLSHDRLIWIIIWIGIVSIFTIVFVYSTHIPECLRRITVDNKGVSSKYLFSSEKMWNWEDIKECGVIRDNSIRNRRTWVTRDERYIFFSLSPFYLIKDKNLISQFKRKDIIFVLYSEQLYDYLMALGVMGLQ